MLKKARITIRAFYKGAEYVSSGWSARYLNEISHSHAQEEIKKTFERMQIDCSIADRYQLRMDFFEEGESMHLEYTGDNIKNLVDGLDVLLNEYDQTIRRK